MIFTYCSSKVWDLSLIMKEKQMTGRYAIDNKLVDKIEDIRNHTDGYGSRQYPLMVRPEGSKVLNALNEGDILITSAIEQVFNGTDDALNTLKIVKGHGAEMHDHRFGKLDETMIWNIFEGPYLGIPR